MPPNYQQQDTTSLFSALTLAAGELGILQVSDAPLAELQSAQDTVDQITAELMRRTSW